MGNTSSASEGSMRITSVHVQVERTLWGKACEVIAQQERGQVMDIVGVDLIEENEGLWKELCDLADILGSYRDQMTEMARRRDETRRKLVGHQKILLEDQIRGMLEKVRDLNGLSHGSSRLATSLLGASDTRQLRGGGQQASLKPTSSASLISGSSASLSSTISSATNSSGSKGSKDIGEYKAFMSVKSVDEMRRLESIADEVREMLREESRLLLEDIEWVRCEIDAEMQSRSKLECAEDAPVSALLSLKQELEVADDREHWSNRLRRAPDSRRKLSDEQDYDPPHLKVVGSGGLAGVFAAAAARSLVSPPLGPSLPGGEEGVGVGSALPSVRSSPVCSPRAAHVEQDDERACEEARDWLALTVDIGGEDQAGIDSAITMLEQQPRKRGQTPGDRFDFGLDDMSD